MKFFTYGQNNSGGVFDLNKEVGIAHYVIIEAGDAEAANARAEAIGLYFDGCDSGTDCPCCGDRWYEASDDDGDDVPSVYRTPITEPINGRLIITWTEPEGFVHYADGRVEAFTRQREGANDGA